MIKVQRNCPHGHGALILLAGWFGLAALQPRPAPGTTLLTAPRLEFAPTGQVLAIRAWRCNACGYIELGDEEVT